MVRRLGLGGSVVVRSVAVFALGSGVVVGCRGDATGGGTSTTTSEGSRADTGSDASTTSASSASSTGSGGDSSGSSSDTGTTGEPPIELTCIEGTCSRTCEFTAEFEKNDGTTCLCDHTQYDEAYVACELPPLCVGASDLCRIQALRYGVPGSFAVDSPGADDVYRTISIEILGSGRARALEYSQMHTCCDGETVESSYIEGFPTTIRADDDPSWTACVETALGFNPPIDCYLAINFGTGACEPPLMACPELDPHVPGCDDACPMANDGICDEPSGTGLCAAGCDPTDCTCIDDVPGQCDEGLGGTCPPGADADDCT